ncbi:unnamed protein product [Enterobius vermicularis]|uniref:ApaG domain-containing protein n=1 Tax=Enterobius vermicularis TaxID=51028 RepID=A0A0N4VLL4_ENTVE|nr:unnamed protein product [Enterobius vermicularis]
MVIYLSPLRSLVLLQDFSRLLGTSAVKTTRFRPSAGGRSPVLKELGRLTPIRKEIDGPYQPGQLFVHKVFAYRGVVICSFSCRVHEKLKAPQKSESTFDSTVSCFYQVLIHRRDWRHMRMPTDLTTYLGECNSRGERPLAVIHGMDCVAHEEIIPYASCETKPVDHELFERIFEVRSGSTEESNLEVCVKKELLPHYLATQRSWLLPQEVYKETTNGVQVLVITFYLGANMINGQQRHCWRYSIRVENLERTTIIVRERLLKIFSLNNLQQLNASGVVGMNPRLTSQEPAFQFSSTINLPQPKGAHMWYVILYVV